MINAEIRKHISWCMKRFNSAFYCYDLDGLKSHLKNLKDQPPEGIKLWYACKANPLSSILKEFRDEDFGVDISSIGEMNHVLNVDLIIKISSQLALANLKNIFGHYWKTESVA